MHPLLSSAIKSDNLHQAQDTIDCARAEFKWQGKRFGACNNISAEVKQAVKSFIKTDHVARRFRKKYRCLGNRKNNPDESMIYILERFEEFCRRTKTPISPEHRIAIYRILIAKLYQAAKVFKQSPIKVCAAVVINSDIHKIPNEREFRTFNQQAWILNRAVLYNTGDPRGYLKRIAHAVRSILKDPNYSVFKSKPWIVRQLAASNPDNLKTSLNNIKTETKRILAEPEFASFKKTPWIVWQAVVNHSSPRSYLRKVSSVSAQIMKNSDFSFFNTRPWIIRHAAANDPRKTRQFLIDIKKSYDEVMSDNRYKALHKKPSRILKALVYNTRELAKFKPAA